jgi:hypothetical protein
VVFWIILGNEVQVRKMTHRTLLEMMTSTYPEPLSVFFWCTLYKDGGISGQSCAAGYWLFYKDLFLLTNSLLGKICQPSGQHVVLLGNMPQV